MWGIRVKDKILKHENQPQPSNFSERTVWLESQLAIKQHCKG
jgi:hypothetical protein